MVEAVFLDRETHIQSIRAVPKTTFGASKLRYLSTANIQSFGGSCGGESIFPTAREGSRESESYEWPYYLLPFIKLNKNDTRLLQYNLTDLYKLHTARL